MRHALRKVCSIWICTDPPKDLANTIECYTLDQHVILGNCPPHRVDKIRLVLVRLSCDEDKNNALDDSLGIIPLLNVCLAKAVNKNRQEEVTQRYHVQLDSEDRDMTAGEQIIYKHHREMWELGEQIKELRENAKKDKEATARILKDALVPIDIIMKSTGLSLEQIEAL